MSRKKLKEFLRNQPFKYTENGFIPDIGETPFNKFYYKIAHRADFPEVDYDVASKVAKTLSLSMFSLVADASVGFDNEIYIFKAE